MLVATTNNNITPRRNITTFCSGIPLMYYVFDVSLLCQLHVHCKFFQQLTHNSAYHLLLQLCIINVYEILRQNIINMITSIHFDKSLSTFYNLWWENMS